MKRTKFSEQQIAFILRQAEEGTAVGEVCRKAGISEAAYYNWRKKYGGLMPSAHPRLAAWYARMLSRPSCAKAAEEIAAADRELSPVLG
jgi:transposase-like protein